MKKFLGMVVLPIAIISAALIVIHAEGLISFPDALIIIGASGVIIAILNIIKMRS